jgi:hypothetical protein
LAGTTFAWGAATLPEEAAFAARFAGDFAGDLATVGLRVDVAARAAAAVRAGRGIEVLECKRAGSATIGWGAASIDGPASAAKL